MSAKDLRCEYSTKDRRHQCPECGRVSQRDGHAQRHSQVSHGKAEGEATQTPQNAECICPEKTARRSFVEYTHEVMRHRQRENPWGDDPAKESTHQPVGFPCPVFHPAIRNVEAGGSQAAEPVEKHAECRIHEVLESELKVKDFQ